MKKLFNKLKVFFFVGCLCSLLACQTTSKAKVDYSSANVISFRYHGYNLDPTVTAEIRDLASIHCGKYGKTSVYNGVELVGITTQEVHTFSCESGKVTVNK